jgi:hypothetical protein
MAWNKVANDTLALLSAEAGRHPVRSAPLGPHRGAVHPKRRIRVRWAAPTSRSTAPASSSSTTRSSATSTCRSSPSHWPADPSQMLLAYTAEPGSPSQYTPRVSWPATTDGFEPAASTDTS